MLLLGCVSPGPDFVAVTSHALAARRSGIKVACEIAVAITLWATLSVLGLAFVLSRGAIVYEAVRLAGAVFLVYLGVRLLLAARQPDRDARRVCRLAASRTLAFALADDRPAVQPGGPG